MEVENYMENNTLKLVVVINFISKYKLFNTSWKRDLSNIADNSFFPFKGTVTEADQ